MYKTSEHNNNITFCGLCNDSYVTLFEKASISTWSENMRFISL